MNVSFKTEIDPTPEQKILIHKTIGCCRWVYNFFLAENIGWHKEGKPYKNAKAFSKWLNNEYLPQHEEYSWLKEVSTKSVKRSLENAHSAYQGFFKEGKGFPKFKKKKNSDVKMYFVRNDANHVIRCDRHRINIPTLGYVRIKEKGYLPVTGSGLAIISGRVSMKAGRYYVSVVTEIPDEKLHTDKTPEGLGIDLGVKDLAVVSNGMVFKNINHTSAVRRLEKKLKREQRSLSRKYEHRKKEQTEAEKKQDPENKTDETDKKQDPENKTDETDKRKGKAKQGRNITKNILREQKIYKRIENIRTDHMRKSICEIVKTKPSYITIEDLNVSGMMKNRHLSKEVAGQRFHLFRKELTSKCRREGIELRIADRFYPSSKMCHCCGKIKKDLKLSDRTYVCGCGYRADRDHNASLNLRDAKTYTLA